jgi:hypothetical protein
MPGTPVTFEPNRNYVREILDTQIDLRTNGIDYVADADLPHDHRSRRYGGTVPSGMVIEQNRANNGRDDRDETEGDNPVQELRATSRN